MVTAQLRKVRHLSPTQSSPAACYSCEVSVVWCGGRPCWLRQSRGGVTGGGETVCKTEGSGESENVEMLLEMAGETGAVLGEIAEIGKTG